MIQSLLYRITQTLQIHDPERAARTRDALGEDVYAAWGDQSDFLDAVFGAAPYLSRLAIRQPDLPIALTKESPEALVEQAISQAEAAAALAV